jgi:uncharacterized protein
MINQEFTIDTSPFRIHNYFLSNLLLFTDTLRWAGISISLNQTFDLAQALELVDIGQRAQVYHATRCILISRKEDLALFDKLFDLFWQAPRPEELSHPDKH